MPAGPPSPSPHAFLVVVVIVTLVVLLLTHFLGGRWNALLRDFPCVTLPLIISALTSSSPHAPFYRPSPLEYPPMDCFVTYGLNVCTSALVSIQHPPTKPSHMPGAAIGWGALSWGDPLPAFYPYISLWYRYYFWGWQGWRSYGMG